MKKRILLMKKVVYLPMLLLLTIGLLAACGGGGNTEGNNNSAENDGTSTQKASKTFELSVPEPEGAKHAIAAQAFKEELERLTDGELSINIHYNNTFGGEREVFEMMGTASLDMAIQGAGPMGIWLPEMNLFDLPFLFESREHAHAVLDSEIGQELGQKFEELANVKILGWVENGFSQTTNSIRPIYTPDDVKGLKIRVQENEVQVDSWRAYGADPTPMAWPEVFTGLQQGVIDGQSNGFPTIASARFYEVQKYVTRMEDRYQPAPIAMSKIVFDSLSPEHQEAVIEAAQATVPVGRQANHDKELEAIGILEENGMEINEPNRELFTAVVEPIYEKWAPQIGQDLVDRVRNFEY